LEASGWAQQFMYVARAWRGAPVHGTVLLEHKVVTTYETLCVSLAAAWRHYDVVKQHRRSH